MKSLGLLVKYILTTSLLLAAFSISFGQKIYDNIPNPLPGNLPSVGFEATSTSEFGNGITFAPSTGRIATTVVLTMSSWGCETGHWYSGDCATTPGATFTHPITLNIYEVGADGVTPGALLATKTQTFSIPYRPSADLVHCTGGRWYDATGPQCFNGFATNITFDLKSLNLTLPDNVIFGIAYNTSHHGQLPIGDSASCYTSSGGCGYDSLNVAVTGPPSIGDDLSADDAYLNSTWSGAYCDGTLGVGSFRLDAGCWTGKKPAIQFKAIKPPKAQEECKGGGWRNLQSPITGQTFINQGQCIQYVLTGK